jgi:mono/diheme cytochrome c family protein
MTAVPLHRPRAALIVLALVAGCGGGGGAGDVKPSDPPVASAEGLDRFLLFPNPQQQGDGSLQTNTPAYAQAYYAAIDPTGTRTTLAAWKAANGFGSAGGEEVSVVFGDPRDLGYGRRMSGRRNADGSLAFVVENYLVNPGGAYGDTTLSIDAAVLQDTRWRVGINAIEFSVFPDGAQPFAKFYSFHPQTGMRDLAVDLDGRGPKAMPGVCVNCHGGRADALAPGGVWAKLKNTASGATGDIRGQLHVFEVGALAFTTLPGHSRAVQEAKLKRLNEFVLCSYPQAAGEPAGTTLCTRRAAENGEWGGSAARVIINAYGGDGLPAASYNDTYLPADWLARGQTTLYRDVVAPHCRACHLLRGTQAASGRGQSDIDFDSFAKFESQAGRIHAHVVNRGNMPLARIVYDAYWAGPAPGLMAGFFESRGLPARDGSGALLRPGRPVADPGPDRTAKTGVALRLSAAMSLFADSFDWQIVSGPPGATLADASQAQARFTAAADGVYRLRLVAQRGSQSSSAELTVTAAAALAPAPDAVRFADVSAVVRGPNCVGCHVAADRSTPVSFAPADLDDDALYAALKGRLNFTDLAASPLLRKPRGEHHGGGQIAGFGLAGDFAGYHLVLNWALGGAPR